MFRGFGHRTASEEPELGRGSSGNREALRLGVNFIDTADLYDTYSYIRRAIERTGIRPVISSKCYAYTREDAKSCLDRALSKQG